MFYNYKKYIEFYTLKCINVLKTKLTLALSINFSHEN